MSAIAPELKSLFGRALELDSPAERSAFLDRECAGQPGQRAEIEALLQAFDRAGSFMREPAAVTVDEPGREALGSMIGPYRLMEEIGEGGMGLVYVAEQLHPVRRMVALKVIKPGMDTREVIARFEAERQALAMMDHPNIARVYDARATDSGRPYFVMELVRGIPITEYCDQNQLAPRERLELFAAVCHAVQHAHQKGIIHRDLKPSNILVTLHDGRPVPKVIDFGVAKAMGQRLTDHTLYTRFTQVVGTPLYMSPEQAEMSGLDIDTRSDVYSLGVLLYELLTGSTPFDRQQMAQAAFDEWRRIIREVDPPKPSTRLSESRERLATIAAQRKTEPGRLTKLIRGDLDWIVMKALEKDRTRRYESASGFARDIERHLRDEPVEACPPSAAYRLRKFVHRHRGPVAVAGVFAALALIAGVWMWIDVRDRRHQERAHSQLLLDAIDQAALMAGQAMAAPSGHAPEWTAARAASERLSDLITTGRIDRDSYDRATTFLRAFRKVDADRMIGAQVEEVLIAGAVHQDRESWTRMEERFRELFRRLDLDVDKVPPAEIAQRIRAHPSSERLADALEMWMGTRGHMTMFGGPSLTLEQMQPWVDALYAADPEPARTAIRKLIYSRKPPKPADVEAAIAGVKLESLSPRTLSWLATVFMMAGDRKRSDEVYAFALRHHPGDLMLNFDYAYMLASTQRWQEAIRLYHRCVALRPKSAGIWRGLGVALRHTKELPLSREALEWSIHLQPDHAATYGDLAETLLVQNEYATAAKTARDGLRLKPDHVILLGCLGRALMRQGELTEALSVLEKCHELAQRDRAQSIDSQAWLDECKRLIAEKAKNP